MRFLLTRPQPDCRSTADRLRVLGHEVDEAPMLVFQPLALPEMNVDRLGALAFTSHRAVDVAVTHPQIVELLKVPVFTVGDRTAEACRAAGFEDVLSAQSDVCGLCRLIAANREELRGSVWYFAAKDRSGDLAGCLADHGVACETLPVYRMAPAAALPPNVAERLSLGSYDGVFVYSGRTAETFARLLKNASLDHILPELPVYAISVQAAGPLKGSAGVHISEFPNETSLLELALGKC